MNVLGALLLLVPAVHCLTNTPVVDPAQAWNGTHMSRGRAPEETDLVRVVDSTLEIEPVTTVPLAIDYNDVNHELVFGGLHLSNGTLALNNTG